MSKRKTRFCGLRSNADIIRGKYAGCEYVRFKRGEVRKLTESEIDRFSAQVQRCSDRARTAAALATLRGE